MGEKRNGLKERDSHIWSLRFALLPSWGIAIFCVIYSLVNNQSEFTHIPPDLSQGANIKPGEFGPSNAYMFANYIWRKTNTWSNSGKVDLKSNISDMACYYTPDFKRWLDNYEKTKLINGELDRTRTMANISNYDEKKHSLKLGDNIFVAFLNMKVVEEINDLPFKELVMRYPLRVVKDTRACNSMGMALDNFYENPKQIGETN